jgi:23S rRNA (uracil1939-C5)-methyltransferase
MAVFVPMTAVGDKIQARIVKAQERYAFGIVETLEAPSPHRAEDDCPVYRRCGGCSLRHMDYAEECRIKEGWVVENLKRIGGVELAPEVFLPSPRCERYRNKAQYPVRLVDGKIRAGFFASRSHTLIPAEDCKLQPEFFRAAVECITGFMEEKNIAPYDEVGHTGLVRHIFIRHGEKTGETMVWLSINGESLPFHGELAARLKEVCPGLVSFGVDVNKQRTNVILGGRLKTLWGGDTITDILCGVRLELSTLSFYQVNRDAAELLFGKALEFADPQPTDVLLDLYCGVGAVGLAMASRVKEVVGVEIVPAAVENAAKNAEANGITNARFLCADASEAASRLEEKGITPDILVLDPPRKGADRAVIDCIGAMSPKKVVYLSCDSATLARDVARLAEYGYKPARLAVTDMFPRTANVESCCLLVKA